MRSFYRVTYYDGAHQLHGDVVATTAAEAAAYLGVSQWISAVVLIPNVELAGVDKPHRRVEPTQPTIAPPFVPLFNEAELDRLGTHLSPDEIRELRSKLSVSEIADLRSKHLTESEAEELKADLKRRDARYVYRHA